MRQPRRVLSILFLCLTLLLVSAAPAVAAPDGVPGSPELLTMDPVPGFTEQSSLVLSGIVLGNFAMELRHGPDLIAFQANGRFEVKVDLTPGVNYFALRAGTTPGTAVITVTAPGLREGRITVTVTAP